MIRIIQGVELSHYPQLANAMFTARAEVFGNRRGWEVRIENGWEKDGYDRPDALYLVSIDDVTGAARGSLRLIPTTGPNMLRDVFGPRYLDGLVIESALAWECTRFCVHPNWATRNITDRCVSEVTVEMLIGICEVGLQAGLEFIVGVFERSMKPIYRRGGWIPNIIGKSSNDPRSAIYCGLWEVSETNLQVMRERSGWQESVIRSTDQIWSAKIA